MTSAATSSADQTAHEQRRQLTASNTSTTDQDRERDADRRQHELLVGLWRQWPGAERRPDRQDEAGRRRGREGQAGCGQRQRSLSISGGNVSGGSSTANQTATNTATANAPNSSTTTQTDNRRRPPAASAAGTAAADSRAVAERPAEGQDEAGRRRGRVGEAVPAEQRRPVPLSLIRTSAERPR